MYNLRCVQNDLTLCRYNVLTLSVFYFLPLSVFMKKITWEWICIKHVAVVNYSLHAVFTRDLVLISVRIGKAVS